MGSSRVVLSHLFVWQVEPATHRDHLEHVFSILQMKAQLEAGMRGLERSQRGEDADTLAATIQLTTESEAAGELLGDTIKAARKRLDLWRNLTASEAKLSRVLCQGASTQQLSRAIQEASVVGVKVGSAKRTLKV
jgi:hypothetical protein